MSTWIRWAVLFLAASFLAGAQDGGADAVRKYLQFDLPTDGPLELLTTDWGRSRIVQRGSAATAELHLTLRFRNDATQPIHGVTLLFRTQDFAPGGKASITLPGLHVLPGEEFPAKVDLRLLQPIAAGAQPRVVVKLDGVLFADLSFVGEDALNSRRLLSVLEMEMRQDRQYLRSLLKAGGKEALGREMLGVISRRNAFPRVDMRWARGGGSTLMPAKDPVQFALLEVPDSPLLPRDASVRIAANEAIEPTVRVENRSKRQIVYAEIGWIVKSLDGREFYAGTLPASSQQIRLEPSRSMTVKQTGILRFSERQSNGSREEEVPVKLGEMIGYVSQVQFADGSIWIPNRYSASSLAKVRNLRVSPEQQRLASLYLREGIDALIADLDRR